MGDFKDTATFNSTAVTLHGAEYLALTPAGAAGLAEILAENMGDGGFSPSMLVKIKIPSGGGTAWEVPTLEDDFDSVKEIKGVIVLWKDRRSYYAEKFDGSKNPPKCYSNDGKVGVGTPGGACHACPHNQFGSASDGAGKACKEYRDLYVITPDSALPKLVKLSTGSLRPCRDYFMKLVAAGLKYNQVITSLALKKAASSGGITYSQALLRVGGRLDDQQQAAASAYTASLKPIIEAAMHQPSFAIDIDEDSSPLAD